MVVVAWQRVNLPLIFGRSNYVISDAVCRVTGQMLLLLGRTYGKRRTHKRNVLRRGSLMNVALSIATNYALSLTFSGAIANALPIDASCDPKSVRSVLVLPDDFDHVYAMGGVFSTVSNNPRRVGLLVAFYHCTKSVKISAVVSFAHLALQSLHTPKMRVLVILLPRSMDSSRPVSLTRSPKGSSCAKTRHLTY